MASTASQEVFVTATKQGLINNRMELVVLENENAIRAHHDTDWSTEQREQLNALNLKGAELLGTFENQYRTNETTTMNFSTLQRQCGLELNYEDLLNPDDKANITDVLNLKRTLQDLKTHHHRARKADFSGVIERSLTYLSKVEDELRKSQIDATELARVPNAVLKNLQDCMNVQDVMTALTVNEDRIKENHRLISECHELRKDSIELGNMQVAEEQYVYQIALLDKTLKCINEKFQIIGATDEENKQFAKIGDVQTEALQETAGMRAHRQRKMRQCQADVDTLEKTVAKATRDDQESEAKYKQAKFDSDRRLQENQENQDRAWNKIQSLQADLQSLASEHMDEVRRRLDSTKKESQRKTRFAQFLHLTTQHKNLLQLTIQNCQLALHTIKLVEDLVSDGCTAIKQRYEATNEELASLRLKVHEDYLTVFQDYYGTLAELCYTKQKAYDECTNQQQIALAQLQLCIDTYDPAAKSYAERRKQLNEKAAALAESVHKMKAKMAAALEGFIHTEDALRAAGRDFDHPVDVVSRRNLLRRSQMLEYRAQLAKPEALRIISERDELAIMQRTLQQQNEATMIARGQIAGQISAGPGASAPGATSGQQAAQLEPPATPSH